jgi:hypothetical protein
MDVVDIIRQRIYAAKPDEHSIPNCDVRLLLLEIDRLRSLGKGQVPEKIGFAH